MAPFEKHFTVNELAELWAISAKSVRRLFQGVDGVLRLAHPSRREGRTLVRRYTTLTIPASVAERVYMRLSKVGK